MLIDANILLYAVDASSTFHDAAAGWLAAQMNVPNNTAPELSRFNS